MRRRRWLVILIGFPLVLALGRLAWFIYLSKPSRQITIGRETTYVEGPVAGDGTVDFFAAAEQQAAVGVTPDNNAVVLLWEAFGSKPTTIGNWEEQFRRLGAPVPQNPTVDEIQLDLLVEASIRSRYYAPFMIHVDVPESRRLSNVLLPLSQSMREGVTRLAGRAGQRMAAGELDEAWEDILACHRLTRLLAQDPFVINSLGGMAHDRSACDASQALIAIPELTADQARRCLRDLQSLPEFRPVAEKVDNVERLAMLKRAMLLAHGEPLDTYAEEQVTLALTGAIDWDIVLTIINDHFDQLVAAMRNPDVREREYRLRQLASAGETLPDVRIAFALQSFVGGREQASRDLAKIVIGAMPEFYFTCLSAETSTIARSRAEQIGFALAVFQRELGEYPETLAVLVPDVMQEIPKDPWTGDAFLYHRTDDGFVLYSVGPNQRDDGGGLTSFEGSDDALMDDIIVRVESD